MLNPPVDRTVLITRRRLLGASASLALVAATGCSAAADRDLRLSTLEEALRELDRLAAASTLDSSAVWTWPQTLVHCAQSIEYSLHGFPELKPAVFRGTVGPAAFAVFEWRGRMSHNRTEPIPGAPSLAPEADAAGAAARLRQAIADFRAAPGPLQPHFAYGALDKPDYERAHALHLADHFSAFDLAVA